MTQPANTAVSRRTALASAFAASAAAVILPPILSTEHLLSLCQNFWTVHHEINSINAVLIRDCGTAEDNQKFEQRLDSLVVQECELLVQIADTGAITERGIQAKAAIVLRILPEAADDFALDSESAEIKLALSLARDVAGGVA